MKIAVVGTGIAGLTAARILARRHRVTVFEANHYIGGHTNTVDVVEGARKLPVDTGFIVFNEPNYPQLCRLFDALSVECRDSDMSFSVQCERTGLEYNGTSMDTLFAQRRNLYRLRFWRMLGDIARFNRAAPKALANGMDDATTVAEYVRTYGYSDQFVEHYLLPLGASLWSCNAERFSRFPIRFVVEFLHNHRMLQVNDRPKWKTVVGGSRAYVNKLIAPFADRVRVNTPVAGVCRTGKGVALRLASGVTEVFDEAILATHADQSARMVDDLDDHEREVLGFFPYQENDVVLHTDTRVLPRASRAWASWNYLLPRRANGHVAVTYNMNMLQGIDSARTYCVSLNHNGAVAKQHVLRRIRYHHPLFVPGRLKAQGEHPALIRRRGLSFCGAYWGYGFHEDGVRSAVTVCGAYDMELAH